MCIDSSTCFRRFILADHGYVDSIFCCGEEHRSARIHWDLTHQFTTQVRFRGWDRGASYKVLRDPYSQRFHCPCCGEGFEMARMLQVCTNRLTLREV